VGAITAGYCCSSRAGTQRYDGWCHNPRYLLDLMPLLALALAFLAQTAALPWRPVGRGARRSALALPPLVASPASPYRHLALAYAPLALALATVALWLGRRPAVRRWFGRRWACCSVGGGGPHRRRLRAARALRAANLGKLEAVRALLPDVPAALFAHQAAVLGLCSSSATWSSRTPPWTRARCAYAGRCVPPSRPPRLRRASRNAGTGAARARDRTTDPAARWTAVAFVEIDAAGPRRGRAAVRRAVAAERIRPGAPPALC